MVGSKMINLKNNLNFDFINKGVLMCDSVDYGEWCDYNDINKGFEVVNMLLLFLLLLIWDNSNGND